MPPYLTAAEAAASLGIHPSRVLAYARAGRLQGRQIGRMWLFTRRDVERFRAVKPQTGPEGGRPRVEREPQPKRPRGRPRGTRKATAQR